MKQYLKAMAMGAVMLPLVSACMPMETAAPEDNTLTIVVNDDGGGDWVPTTAASAAQAREVFDDICVEEQDPQALGYRNLSSSNQGPTWYHPSYDLSVKLFPNGQCSFAFSSNDDEAVTRAAFSDITAPISFTHRDGGLVLGSHSYRVLM